MSGRHAGEVYVNKTFQSKEKRTHQTAFWPAEAKGVDGMTEEQRLARLEAEAVLEAEECRKRAKEAFAREDWETALAEAERGFRRLMEEKREHPSPDFVAAAILLGYLVIASRHNFGRDDLRLASPAVLDGLFEVVSLVLEGSILGATDEYLRRYLELCAPYGYYALFLAWIRVGARCLTDEKRAPLFFAYVKKIRYRIPGRQVEWLNLYEEGLLQRYVKEESEVLGEWLCANFEREEVRRLVWFSTLYEEVALDYAYRHQKKALAHAIINDNYDRYLEMPTLFLLWKYDKKAFFTYVDELKYICFRRLLEQFHYSYVDRTSPFAREMIALSYRYLARRNKEDTADPKNSKVKENNKYNRED